MPTLLLQPLPLPPPPPPLPPLPPGSLSYNASYPKVLLIHNFHEGSHAICEAMRYCLPADCTERYDSYHSPKLLMNVHGVQSASGLVLLRVDQEQRQVPWLPRSAICILVVRTNLMLWALSSYKRLTFSKHLQEVTGRLPPQFDSNISVVQPIHINVKLLQQKVLPFLEVQWRDKVSTLRNLLRHNISARVITYEQFLEGGDAYIRTVLDAVGVRGCASARGDLSPPPPLGDKVFGGPLLGAVHRVHGDYVRDYASNVNEVLRYWATVPHVQWSNLAAEFESLHI